MANAGLTGIVSAFVLYVAAPAVDTARFLPIAYAAAFTAYAAREFLLERNYVLEHNKV